LEYQGGKMSKAEAEAFEKDPLFSESIRMRHWDEMAKLEHIPIILEKLKLASLRVLKG
jgi:predicted HD phosphohydrolase